MGKERKRNSAREYPYTIEDLKKAVDEVNNKGRSVFSVSKAYNVPYATLHSRVKGKFPIVTRPGPPTVLSEMDERALATWSFKMMKQGFPVSKEILLNSVQHFVVKTGKDTPFTNGRPSRHWYKAFLRRNPDVSEKVCQNLNKARASVTEKNIRDWFTEIETYIVSKNINITAERVFNLDESAFCLNPKNGKVLVRRGEKACYNVCGNEKECYTALIGGNAAGSLLPTMVIYNQERISNEIAINFPDDFVIGKSETGWMTSETFYSYVVNHLYRWCVENHIVFPILLFVDSHSSHLTKALSDFCCEKNIELIALYPNATHIMQPMDVALFHPLKSAYKNAVRNWRMDNDGAILTKPYFAKVLKTALQGLDIKSIFNNGFKKCGLYPFSPDNINYDKLITTSKASAVSNQSNQENENDTVVREEIIQQNASNKEDPLILIESNINPSILQKFKDNNFQEWTGELQFKELYNFWLNVSKKSSENNVTTNSIPPASATSSVTVDMIVENESTFLEENALHSSIEISEEVFVDDTSYDPLADSNVIVLDTIPINQNRGAANNEDLPPNTDFLSSSGLQDLNSTINTNAVQLTEELDSNKISCISTSDSDLDLCILRTQYLESNNSIDLSYNEISRMNIDQGTISPIKVSSQNACTYTNDLNEPLLNESENFNLKCSLPTLNSSICDHPSREIVKHSFQDFRITSSTSSCDPVTVTSESSTSRTAIPFQILLPLQSLLLTIVSL